MEQGYSINIARRNRLLDYFLYGKYQPMYSHFARVQLGDMLTSNAKERFAEIIARFPPTELDEDGMPIWKLEMTFWHCSGTRIEAEITK